MNQKHNQVFAIADCSVRKMRSPQQVNNVIKLSAIQLKFSQKLSIIS
ncbi:hypothetical protein [Calothrix sp. NIES-2100]